ncbi:ABC transporter substrate-binding protein [Amorphoplanes nipponensis]|uniref:Sugar ABC transporter substrate-binding protein n=1 Tax=Actinoplanes nipponensis TaxID=135950 RepID=A0A919JNF0_9ACTN|nr:ABC transporter substrate-binding protein [Actinoplanes nipponensis]GIE54254.1 sugar ABC transporter substrate-binding protein [Actinoplanes nipponensis]
MTSRRAVLGGALGAVVAGAGGCGGSGRPVQVAVVWSGGELVRFREVVRQYPQPVDVVSTRNDIDAFLSARYRAGNQPDVAIVPQISLIADYARRGWLQPVPPEVTGRFADNWRAMLTVDGREYGAWVKAAHKSLVWYSPDRQGPPPDTWPAFVSLVRELAGAGRRAPLAIGAADGWVLTDWLENLLIGLAADGQYQGLVDGAEPWDGPLVRTALTELAAVWAIPGAFPDGIGRALITQQEESVIQVAEGRAAMVVEGDFVAATAERFRPAGATALTAARFPAGPRGRPLLVAGDAAMVFAGSRAGAELLEWLTRPESFRPWIAAGGYLSPNTLITPDAYGPAAARAAELSDPGGAPRFDLSDQLRGSLGGPDGLGSWKILQDFLAEVNRPGAVDRACRRLVRAAAQARREAGS